MKLYNIPRGSKIKVETHNQKNEKIGDFVTFDHLDGMYSYCTVDDCPSEEYNVLHISASQELVKVENEDYYELA